MDISRGRSGWRKSVYRTGAIKDIVKGRKMVQRESTQSTETLSVSMAVSYGQPEWGQAVV
jgi:hypothetical protein